MTIAAATAKRSRRVPTRKIRPRTRSLTSRVATNPTSPRAFSIARQGRARPQLRPAWAGPCAWAFSSRPRRRFVKSHTRTERTTAAAMKTKRYFTRRLDGETDDGPRCVAVSEVLPSPAIGSRWQAIAPGSLYRGTAGRSVAIRRARGASPWSPIERGRSLLITGTGPTNKPAQRDDRRLRGPRWLRRWAIVLEVIRQMKTRPSSWATESPHLPIHHFGMPPPMALNLKNPEVERLGALSG